MERHLNIGYHQLEIAATLHYPVVQDESDWKSSHPAVVICHGFVGNRIGVDRLFVKAARRLAAAGYVVLRFDYAGCGESDGDYGSTGIGSLIEQTRNAIDVIFDLDIVDASRITLLGHSLGGAVAVLTAAQDRRVRNLVLWAPVAHPHQDIVGIIGNKLYEEALTKGQTEYLGYTFQSSFLQSLSLFQPLVLAREFAGDVLLIHGTGDTVISSESSFLYQKIFWTRKQGICDKEIIMQADHSFSTRGHAEHAITKTIEWLETKEKNKQGWYDWTI
jgi:hypothetical protein